ncbi:hypothetical protein [Rhizobium leguminosarum]
MAAELQLETGSRRAKLQWLASHSSTAKSVETETVRHSSLHPQYLSKRQTLCLGVKPLRQIIEFEPTESLSLDDRELSRDHAFGRGVAYV